jgi:uncharacterized protein (TIGR02246 family)
MTEDERAIRALADRWLTATKSGDAGTVLSLMADDAVFMTPGAAPFGKDAFAAALRGMEGARFEGQSEILEIEVLGDRAWLRTRLEVTMTPPGGAPVRRAGHTLSILRKAPDGRWLIARDANLLAKEG